MDIIFLGLLFCKLFDFTRAAIDAPENICKGKNSLRISCSVDDIADLDTVYSITISKKSTTSLDFNNIVRIYSKPPGLTLLHWYNSDLEIRGGLEVFSLFPPSASILVFKIDGGHLETTDSGEYKCTVSYGIPHVGRLNKTSTSLVTLSEHCNTVAHGRASGLKCNLTEAFFLVWNLIFYFLLLGQILLVL